MLAFDRDYCRIWSNHAHFAKIRQSVADLRPKPRCNIWRPSATLNLSFEFWIEFSVYLECARSKTGEKPSCRWDSRPSKDEVDRITRFGDMAIPVERAMVVSYMLSIVTIVLFAAIGHRMSATHNSTGGTGSLRPVMFGSAESEL